MPFKKFESSSNETNEVRKSNKEIELKMQLDQDQLAIFFAWILKHAAPGKTIQQKDYYFNHPANSFKYQAAQGFIDAHTTLRVRLSKEGDFICCKYRKVDDKNAQTIYREEYESQVVDGLSLIKMLELNGFTEKTLIFKERRLFFYQDFEIAFDQVQGLGSFVEIELKNDSNDHEKGMKQIVNFLMSTGVKEYIVHDRSYLHMMWNPTYSFGSKVTTS